MQAPICVKGNSFLALVFLINSKKINQSHKFIHAQIRIQKHEQIVVSLNMKEEIEGL
jgi:hypothetical protein